MLTDKQFENCQRAIALLEQTPEHLVDLNTFTGGSTHCAFGWLATDEYFSSLGIYFDKNNFPAAEENFPEIFGESTAHYVVFFELFSSANGSPLDKLQPTNLSHKQLAIGRFKLHIERHKEIK